MLLVGFVDGRHGLTHLAEHAAFTHVDGGRVGSTGAAGLRRVGRGAGEGLSGAEGLFTESRSEPGGRREHLGMRRGAGDPGPRELDEIVNRSGGGVVVGDGAASLPDLVRFGDAIRGIGLCRVVAISASK